MEESVKTLSADKEIKILSDPYRVRIMNIYNGSSKPLTVKEVAVAMKEEPAKVHYHVKKLLSIDVLELDHMETINGIRAKYYRLAKKSARFEFSKQLSEFKEEMHKAYIGGNSGCYMRESCCFDIETFELVNEEIRGIIQKYKHQGNNSNSQYSVFFGAVHK